jgi:integrase
MTKWGQAHRIGGRRLLGGDPMVGLVIPSEKNAKRPVATEARYQALLAVADRAEPTGRFRCVLTIARTTGRRIAAICALQRSDVLLSPDQMRRALAAAGMDVAHAEQWTHGAIVWQAASDKLGFEAITPISAAARAALIDYLRAHPSVGDAPLFPGTEDVTRSIGKEMAGYWLRRAERLAKLEHLARGGFHALRRLWASQRHHLPPHDVAAAGGWRSLQVMRSSYMHADAEGVLSAVESRSTGPTQGPPDSQVAHRQRDAK